jgi:hypothetical protein
VTVVMDPIGTPFLAFPDLAKDALVMGPCYVTSLSAYAKVMTLRLRNLRKVSAVVDICLS